MVRQPDKDKFAAWRQQRDDASGSSESAAQETAGHAAEEVAGSAAKRETADGARRHLWLAVGILGGEFVFMYSF